MDQPYLNNQQLATRTIEVLAEFQKAWLAKKAVPLLCIAGVAGVGGSLPIGTLFTINCQDRSPAEVLKLLKNTVKAMEARMQ